MRVSVRPELGQNSNKQGRNHTEYFEQMLGSPKALSEPYAVSLLVVPGSERTNHPRHCAMRLRLILHTRASGCYACCCQPPQYKVRMVQFASQCWLLLGSGNLVDS